jgi:hypothetical protein
MPEEDVLAAFFPDPILDKYRVITLGSEGLRSLAMRSDDLHSNAAPAAHRSELVGEGPKFNRTSGETLCD